MFHLCVFVSFRLLEKQSSLLESLVSSLSEKRTDDSVPRDQSRDLDLDRGRYRSVQINGEADTPAGFDFDSRGAIRSAQRDEEVNTDRRREMANNEVDEGRKGSNNEAEGNANVNTNAKASRYSAKTNVQDDAGDVVYDDYYSTYQWDEGSRRGSSSSSSRSSRGDGYDSGYSNSGYRNRETTATPGNNYARGSGGAGGYGYRAMDDDFVSPPRRFSDRQRTRNVVRSTGRLIRGVGEFSRVAARSVVEILGFWVGLQIYDDMEDSDGDVTSRNSNDRFSDRVSGTGRRMSSREQPTASLVEAKALPSGNQYGYDELNDGSTLFIDSLGNTNSYSQFRDQIVAEDLKDYSDDTADWERDTRKSI